MGLLELAVLHAGKGLQGIYARTKFIHAHIELGTGQAVLQPGEENGNLPRLHGRMLGNQFVGAVLGVQIQQMPFLAQHLATLVQFPDIHPHIQQFRLVGDINDFLALQHNAVHLAQGAEEGNDHRRAGGKPADGKRAFNDAADAQAKPMVLGQHQRGAAKIIGPVPLLLRRNRGDVPLGPLGELQGGHLHHAVPLGCIGNVDALVNGQAGNLAQIVV